MPARRELRMRTVFNLLGPLTNPAGASAQVVGVYEANFTELLARALGELGVRRAFVVHGADGMDEISLSGETSSRNCATAGAQLYSRAGGFRLAPRAARIDSRRRRQTQRRNHSQNLRPLAALPRARPASRHRAGECGGGARCRWPRTGFPRWRASRAGIDRLRAARTKLDALVAFSKVEKPSTRICALNANRRSKDRAKSRNQDREKWNQTPAAPLAGG